MFLILDDAIIFHQVCAVNLQLNFLSLSSPSLLLYSYSLGNVTLLLLSVQRSGWSYPSPHLSCKGGHKAHGQSSHSITLAIMTDSVTYTGPRLGQLFFPETGSVKTDLKTYHVNSSQQQSLKRWYICSCPVYFQSCSHSHSSWNLDLQLFLDIVSYPIFFWYILPPPSKFLLPRVGCL